MQGDLVIALHASEVSGRSKEAGSMDNQDTKSRSQSPETGDIVLEVSGITKRFPGVTALNNVSFTLRRGEIHGLVGENGAGKSTLLKILSGVYQADEGEIRINGGPVLIRNPIEAQEKGICMEYQEKTLFPNLSVAENICVGKLGECSGNPVVVSWDNVHKTAAAVLKRLHFEIDTKLNIRELSPQLQQIVQIARAIAINGKILILDEPTAAISFSQVDKLFEILRNLKAEGYSIIYVSHHLKEVFRITDRVTVFKDGQGVGTYTTSELTEQSITRLMIGREIVKGKLAPVESSSPIVFEARNLTTADKVVEDVSFIVRKGEIYGFAGLVGSGKDALARAIAGSVPVASGQIVLNRAVFVPKKPKQVIRKGITVLPAERSLEGLVLGQSLNFNITLSAYSKYSRFGIMNSRKDYELAEGAARNVNLKYVTIRQLAMSLSGGNQQRLMIARSLLADAKVLVFNEPTQGVDVGAKQEIYKLIRAYAAEDKAVIVISSELPEILTLCNRIGVMSKGHLTKEYTNEEATEEKLLSDMIG
jgi:ribose transport system ATP-binding protein